MIKAIALEPDGEFALLLFAISRFVKVGIIPSVALKYILQGGGAKNETHLIARHAFVKLRNLFGGNPVALLDSGPVRKSPIGRAAGG